MTDPIDYFSVVEFTTGIPEIDNDLSDHEYMMEASRFYIEDYASEEEALEEARAFGSNWTMQHGSETAIHKHSVSIIDD